jgi:sugar (pentulose or hexulose) kinase
MMADVIGLPVAASGVAEASSRGAAMLAMKAFGQIKDFSELPTPLGEVFEPNRDNYELYQDGREKQEKLYNTLINKKWTSS